MEYGDGSAAEQGLSDSNISSLSSCNGALLTLSCIVKEEDAIKCYLFWRGQMIRFIPKNAKILLEHIFHIATDGGQERQSQFGLRNRDFLNGKVFDQMMQKMSTQTRDKYFEMLYK